jgi:hypothetical protein
MLNLSLNKEVSQRKIEEAEIHGREPGLGVYDSLGPF